MIGLRLRRKYSRYGRKKHNRLLGFRSKKRFYRKKLKSRDITIVNNTKPGYNIPINPRYLTKFTLSYSGYTTTINGRNNGYFALKLNGLNQPVLVNPTTITAPNFTAPENGTGLANGLSAATDLEALQPRGYSQLCSSVMYNKYRVYASKIKVTAIPGAIGDSAIITVIPVTNDVGIADLAGLSQNVAYSKERVVTQGADNNTNTVRNYIDLQSLLGKNKFQLMADDKLSADYNADPQDLSLWLIKYNRMNGTTNFSAQIIFNIEVVYYAELFEMNYESMTK